MIDNKKIKSALENYVDRCMSDKSAELDNYNIDKLDARVYRLISEYRGQRAHSSFPRAVTCLIIVLLLSLSFVTTGTAYVMPSKVKVCSSDFGTRITNHDEEDTAPTTIEKAFAPDFSAWTLVDCVKEDYYYEYIYTKNGTNIEFVQKVVTAGEFIAESVETESLIYDGLDYLFIKTDDKNVLLWNKYNYSFSLISSDMTKEELLQTAQTLAPLQ